MNSNRSYKMIWLVGVALLASCFGAGLARAQEYAGKFTLPFEARWGRATLPAGDYSFKLDKSQSSSTIQLFQGKVGIGFIKSQAYDLKDSGENSLVVVKTKTGKSVSELRLPEIGVVLHYATKQTKPIMAAEDRGIPVVIPVTITGK
jgi:hypothetical protein